MSWGDEARASFRAMLLSPWGVLLAILILIGPIVTAIHLLGGPGTSDGSETQAAIAIGILSSATSATVWNVGLVAMAAAGAWAPGPSATAAFSGRAGAWMLLLAGGWGLPMLLLASSRAGAAALYPSVLMFAILALLSLAWLAVFTLAAELAFRAQAMAVVSAYVLLGVIVPQGIQAALSFTRAGFGEPAPAWYGWASFASPDLLASELRSATFPRRQFNFFELELAPPWVYAGALVAWIAVPFLLLALTDRKGTIEHELEDA
ncbi:MAG TPA: hypothetical protein VM370_02785 [Candidatus Thermoplasmatota archaeon]|nr:hypothetical protein [Candidatus Thermoplasmatota archaeon]